MRSRAPQFLAVIAAVCCLPIVASSQIVMRPTPEPNVTAQNESWYLAGEPIMFAGNIYFPTGPNIYFNANEMVRSGDYNGVPLYSRTTIEPYSIVYVPLPGRLMKPYERRRAGEIAGTVGSTLPSFPVVHTPEPELVLLPQAAAPPTLTAPILGTSFPAAAAAVERGAAPEPTATTGVAPPLGPLVSARKPQGLDAIFVDYGDQRWFLSGPAVELEASQFTSIGDYRGFAVYRKGGDEKTIYVAVSAQARAMVAPYSMRR